jgi:hypothetical protein
MARRRGRHPPRRVGKGRRGGLGADDTAADVALRKIEKEVETGSCLDAFEVALAAAAHFGRMSSPEDLARLRRIHKKFRIGCALK